MDGKADLATTSYVNSNSMNVLIGNGDGSFQASISAGLYPTSVAMGDFNEDGNNQNPLGDVRKADGH